MFSQNQYVIPSQFKSLKNQQSEPELMTNNNQDGDNVKGHPYLNIEGTN